MADRQSSGMASGEMTPGRSWRIVRRRDVRFDGAFVYAVGSTGIYCRPSCPSRRPARRRVAFYRLPELAEAAGFRPCRRCRPHEASAADPAVERVRALCRQIDARPGAAARLAALARQAGLSPHHLQKTFKRIVGITPRQYAEARRLERLKTGLRKGDTVSDALYEAGYGSSSRLYEKAPEHLGMTPATYRAGGEGTRIAYSILRTRLGRLLVAATPRGLCAVSLADTDRPLEAFLSREYPAAEIHRDDAALAAFAPHLLRCLEGLPPERRLPVDVRATAFQWKVYEALRAIPPGETLSYGALARSLGRPKGARAVARACATNRVAVVIPCHRVVREDGSLGGYRWGMKRKEALLAAERQAATGKAAAGRAAAGAGLTGGRAERPARSGAPLSSS